ncbi:MAG: FKBP-type peptidyl-prolyl cis-trans isomerase [Halioglobus sp.]
MNKYALPLALVGVFALQACTQKMEEKEVDSAPAAAVDESLDTADKRLSYGIAYGLGQRMIQDSVPIDTDAFAMGFKDSLNGVEARLTQEEIAAEMQAYQADATAKAQAKQAAAGQANQVAGEAFLKENAAKEGVIVTESGLQYQVVKAGEGAKPGATDTVEVHYRGTTIEGKEFDSSYSRGETVKFGVTQVIPGWTEALQLMSVGSTYKLAIPSDLAYGAGGAGGGMIGPNATLLFDVELVSIPSQEAPEK